jgi:hypothetical protein
LVQFFLSLKLDPLTQLTCRDNSIVFWKTQKKLRNMSKCVLHFKTSKWNSFKESNIQKYIPIKNSICEFFYNGYIYVIFTYMYVSSTLLPSIFICDKLHQCMQRYSHQLMNFSPKIKRSCNGVKHIKPLNLTNIYSIYLN